MKRTDMFTVVVILLLAAMVYYITQTPGQAKQLAVTGGGGVGGNFATGDCIYNYASPMIQPRMVLSFQDAVGTAVAPTLYFYTPAKVEGKANQYADWGDEMTFTDSSGEYFKTSASPGNITDQNAGTSFYFHASLAAYQDKFEKVVVPSCGSMTPGDARSTAIGYGTTYTMPAFDTTQWNTSSSQSMAVPSASNTNYKLSKQISYNVLANKEVDLGRLTIDRVHRFAETGSYDGAGIREITLKIAGAGGNYQTTIYKYPNIDKTVYYGGSQVAYYDSNTYSTDKSGLKGIKIPAGQTATLTFEVFADTAAAGNCGTATLVANTSCIVMQNVKVFDIEGNSLLGATFNVTA